MCVLKRQLTPKLKLFPPLLFYPSRYVWYEFVWFIETSAVQPGKMDKINYHKMDVFISV